MRPLPAVGGLGRPVTPEAHGWLTAVGAYNQGLGFANRLVYQVFAGPADYNAQSLDAIFNPQTIGKLGLSRERQEEMPGEVAGPCAAARSRA